MGDTTQPPLVKQSAVGPESAAGAVPATRWMRAVFLAPQGDGATRRRASDAFRLGFAVAGVAVSIPVMRANSAAELAVAHALNPPPETIRWLVTSLFWLGSVGVAVLLTILGLLVPRRTAIRWIVVAGEDRFTTARPLLLGCRAVQAAYLHDLDAEQFQPEQ